MLSRVEERAIHLLASGLLPTQTASILGVTPALVSQWKTKEEFSTALEAATIEASKGDKEEVALTAKYHAAEHALIDQVLAMAPIAELKDVTAALRVIGERQNAVKIQKNPITMHPSSINQTIVNLTLPSHALPEFSTNNSNQITAIDTKSIAPMSAAGISELFKNFTISKAEKIEVKNNEGDSNDTSRIPSSPEGSTLEASAAQ